MIFPDRAEYFWARADGQGLGPSPQAPLKAARRLDYHELSMYTEAATGRFSFFVNVPYRSVDPDGAAHGAGFGSVDLGTKTLLFDCELLQVSFQFRTFLPGGNPRSGLGDGHTSLEPSLIVGVNLAPETYLQAQVAEWIPLGGNQDYEGAILHYHVSYNRVLARPIANVPLVGTVEFNGWSFQDGLYTDPVLGPQRATGETYLSLGPGLRLVICDKVDFGVAAAFSLTRDHFADTLIRSELRWRY